MKTALSRPCVHALLEHDNRLTDKQALAVAPYLKAMTLGVKRRRVQIPHPIVNIVDAAPAMPPRPIIASEEIPFD